MDAKTLRARARHRRHVDRFFEFLVLALVVALLLVGGFRAVRAGETSLVAGRFYNAPGMQVLSCDTHEQISLVLETLKTEDEALINANGQRMQKEMNEFGEPICGFVMPTLFVPLKAFESASVHLKGELYHILVIRYGTGPFVGRVPTRSFYGIFLDIRLVGEKKGA